MIYSLTGYGRAEVNDGDISYSIEIRSLNSRFLEISTRVPRSLMSHDHKFRQKIKDRIPRGKMQLNISEPRESVRNSKFGFDTNTVESILGRLREVGQKTGLKDDLGLSNLIYIADWVAPEDDESIEEKRLELVLQGVDLALDDFSKMCAEEGDNLSKDLEKRLVIISDLVENVKSKAAENRDELLTRLHERIQQYLKEELIDNGRLEQEAALMVDRIDITEEVVRMRSHVDLFRNALKKGGSVGKRLNFIMQEMNREINTMGSKAAAPEISSWVIEAKEELEKIREQVQNVA